MTKFNELGISEEILKALDDMEFEETFPIQEAAIPVLLSGRDVVGQGPTRDPARPPRTRYPCYRT